jgi:hypothetical protein
MANINFKIAGKQVVGDAVKVSIRMLTPNLDTTDVEGAISMKRLTTDELPIILNAIRHDPSLMNTEVTEGFDYVFDLIFD